MAKGSRKIPRKHRRDRILAENPGLDKKINSLLVEVEGSNIEPPCLMCKTQRKPKTKDNRTKDPKNLYKLLTIKRDRKRVPEYVHRLVYILHYGGIPAGYEVCHLCNNPGCANIEHLWAASQETHRGKNGLDPRFRKFYRSILEKAKGKMIITRARKPEAQHKDEMSYRFLNLNSGHFSKKRRKKSRQGFVLST